MKLKAKMNVLCLLVWGFCPITRTLEASLLPCWWRKPQCRGTKDIPRYSVTNTTSCIHHSPVQCYELGLPPFLLCLLISLPWYSQLRKDASAPSAALTGGSAAAPTPTDTPQLPEAVAMEAEEGNADREAEGTEPKGASSAPETPAGDGVCGWVMLIWGALKSYALWNILQQRTV